MARADVADAPAEPAAADPAAPAWNAFSCIPSPLLRSGAQRVATTWRDGTFEEFGQVEVVEELVAVAIMLGSGEIRRDNLDVGGLILRRHLLELLRAEMVRQWRAASPPPAPGEMLELLGSFEALRESVQPEADQSFASRLMGPEGVEHLMEIAHDLRSPLTSILFLAETLRRGQSGTLTDVQHRQVGIIYSAALGLTGVVSDIIELARGGNRLMDKQPSPFSVAETLESVRDIVRPMAEERGLAVRLLTPATDRRLGHPVALSRVLLNLTSNALKFTEDGSVEITARAKGAASVEFSVRDTGTGIKPDLLHSLYQPFRRSRRGQGYAFSGSGLGLAICRKLVEAMGAELELETDPEWGSRFFFTLQLPPAPQQPR